MLSSYRNQSIDLFCKSIDWFLYDGNIGSTCDHLVICKHMPCFDIFRVLNYEIKNVLLQLEEGLFWIGKFVFNIMPIRWALSFLLLIVAIFILYMTYFSCWSSRPKMFCKKGVLEDLAKFTGKHLCQSLFFNKVSVLRPAGVFFYRCFPVNFVKFLRTPFSQNTFGRLLLFIVTLALFFVVRLEHGLKNYIRKVINKRQDLQIWLWFFFIGFQRAIFSLNLFCFSLI